MEKGLRSRVLLVLRSLRISKFGGGGGGGG